MLGVLTGVGIISSIFLLFGIVKQKSGMMICWICLQGITIVYQIFITIDFAFVCCKFTKIQSFWAVFASSVILFVIDLEVHFMIYITKIYQNIVHEKAELRRPKETKYIVQTAAITPNDLLYI